MDFDADGHLGAVDRTVSSLERDGRPARDVALSRTYPADTADVWALVTSAERITRWFAPITGQLELGGRYQIEGNAGGVVETCVPRSHFGVTWEFGGDVSWVALRLVGDDDGTRLTLTHTQHLSPHWDEYGPGAVGVGWEMGLLGLALYLADPAKPKIDEAAFVASAEGKAYVGGSAQAWGQAAIANGEDADKARAAADRTRAFYTGT